MRTDNRVLEGFLREVVPRLEGGRGRWHGVLDGVEIAVVTDEVHDRMRIMTAVAEPGTLRPQDLVTLLSANFDRALDAKYALWNGTLWSVFVHPLSSLSRPELASAVRQVVALRKNYGTSFTSTDLTFGGGRN
jgi:hypothetical protein